MVVNFSCVPQVYYQCTRQHDVVNLLYAGLLTCSEEQITLELIRIEQVHLIYIAFGRIKRLFYVCWRSIMFKEDVPLEVSKYS